MFACVHRRLRQEEGISLVEMLVSILLMGLVLAALGNTLFASMAAARQSEGLTQATAIANEELEKLQVASWATLDPAASPLPAVPPIVRDGRSYQIVREVSWIESPHYKRYAVTVNWTENSDPHTLTVEGRRARRAGESNTPVAPINPFRVLSFTINPDPVHLDTASKTLSADPAVPAGPAMYIDVEMNEPARTDSIVVTWPQPSPTRTLTLTEVAGSGGRKFTGSLPSGETYPSGWLTFRVTAAKAGTTTTCTASPLPASPNCAESTTAAYLLAPIQNGPLYYDDNKTRLYSGTPGPSGDRMCLNGSTLKLRNSNPFWFGLKGLGVDDTVTLVRTDVAGVSFPMIWEKVQGSFWWTGTAASSSSGTFTPKTESTWEIRWTRNYDNLSGTIPLRFYMYNANGNSAC